VADNGQAQYGPRGSGGSMNWQQNNAQDQAQSIQKVVDGFSKNHKVSAYLWDAITSTQVDEYSKGDFTDGYILYPEEESTGAAITYPKFKTQYGTYVSFKEGIWNEEAREYDSDKLKVLNVPVLKFHKVYQVTAAVKHYMGVVSDKLTKTDAHYAVGHGFMGTQFVKTRMPVLNIIDCIYINAISGPASTYHIAHQMNMVLASTDPIAVDYYASKHILLPMAEEFKNPNYKVIDPDVNRVGYFGQWLILSAREFLKEGIFVTMEESKIKVFED